MKDHRLIDQRSLAFGELIARRLREQPGLLSLARENIARWQGTASPGVNSTLVEWAALLEGPLEEVLCTLTSPDENSTRLRQSNPFAGVLSPEERFAVLRRFEPRDTATA